MTILVNGVERNPEIISSRKVRVKYNGERVTGSFFYSRGSRDNVFLADNPVFGGAYGKQEALFPDGKTRLVEIRNRKNIARVSAKVRGQRLYGTYKNGYFVPDVSAVAF